jgi:sorting nexin-1/2
VWALSPTSLRPDCEPIIAPSHSPLLEQVSYNVTTFTSLDQYQSAETTVTRRYNHFVWLHTTLEEQFPCYFIPSLPEKTGIVPLFNRFQDDFVEGRRIALEQYIARLVRHPVIQTSKPLQVFLEGDEGLMRLPEEKKPSLLGSLMGGLAPTPKPPHVPDEEFDAMRNYVKDFEVQLAELHKFLERLIRRRKDLASSLAELGLTLITLAGHEQQTGDPDSQGASKACTDLGSCCDHLSISLQHQANDEAKKALMVVDDWLRVVRGAKQAIKARGLAAGSTVLLR